MDAELHTTPVPSVELGQINLAVEAIPITGKEEQTQANDGDELMCPICLESLYLAAPEDLSEGLKRNPYFRTMAYRQHQYMKAPCGHKYHITCLLNWVEIKPECPSCRLALPPI